MQYFPTSEVVTVKDWPYGFRWNVIWNFRLSFTKRKGLDQSLNPVTQKRGLEQPKEVHLLALSGLGVERWGQARCVRFFLLQNRKVGFAVQVAAWECRTVYKGADRMVLWWDYRFHSWHCRKLRSVLWLKDWGREAHSFILHYWQQCRATKQGMWRSF